MNKIKKLLKLGDYKIEVGDRIWIKNEVVFGCQTLSTFNLEEDSADLEKMVRKKLKNRKEKLEEEREKYLEKIDILNKEENSIIKSLNDLMLEEKEDQ